MFHRMIEHCQNHDIEENEAACIYTLYLELCEVKKYWDVSWGSRNKYMFCSARKRQTAEPSIFLPLNIKKQLNLAMVEELQSLFNTQIITLVIQHPDSTSLHYELSKGLFSCSEEESITSLPDSYIKTHKKYLYTKALDSKSLNNTDSLN